jgi:cysteine desulfurase
MALDLAGFSLSSGSACSSGKVKPSHVLSAMGVPAGLAKGALRVSLGWDTRPEDTEGLCDALEKAVSNMRARRGRSAA